MILDKVLDIFSFLSWCLLLLGWSFDLQHVFKKYDLSLVIYFMMAVSNTYETRFSEQSRQTPFFY